MMDNHCQSIFQNSAHRLDLEDAIARGLLVPIRTLRVWTNVDSNEYSLQWG